MSLKRWMVVSAVSCALAPAFAAASSLGVTGGPGLDVGSLCLTSDFFCSANSAATDLNLSGTNNPVSGSFSYDAADNEISFSLTLTQNVTFTGPSGTEILAAGSTFSASNIAVSTPNGGVVNGSGGTAAAALFASTSGGAPFASLTDPSVVIDSVSCTVVGSGQCGVQLGVGGFNVLSVGGQSFDAAITFNANVSPVPLPAAAWLLVSALGGLVAVRRRVNLISGTPA